MARLILTLLGGFRARLDSGIPLALPTRKAQALLAYLAVPAGSPHPRDKLASLLWGDTMETTARTSLRQTLYALRKSLREADPQPLVLHGDTVALDSSAVTLDVQELERLAAQTTPSALAEAAALYEGDFLEGFAVQEQPFEEWLLAHRERLREVAVSSLSRLLAHQRAAGSHDSAVRTALRLLRLDPIQEPVHRALMQLYVETGRRGSALRQYQVCVATLQRELRAEPEAETKALYQEILRRRVHVMPEPPSEPVLPVTARPRPEVTEPPPAWEPPLVGRRRDLSRLTEALDEAFAGHGRLAVLVGEAGAGKSRLVAELSAAATRRLGRVLIGRCYETEADPALRALGERSSGRPCVRGPGNPRHARSPAGGTSWNGCCRSCRVTRSRPRLLPGESSRRAAVEILATRSRRSASYSSAWPAGSHCSWCWRTSTGPTR